MTNYTQFKDCSASQKLMVFILLLLICVPGLAAAIKPLNTRGETLPVTPPITPPISPSISPSPTPVPNQPPVITTDRLYNGKKNYSYTGFVRGYDPDPNDPLFMEIINLPRGINMVACQNYPAGTIRYITCRLEGKPTQRGTFQVLIILHDNQGNMARKVLALKII